MNRILDHVMNKSNRPTQIKGKQCVWAESSLKNFLELSPTFMYSSVFSLFLIFSLEIDDQRGVSKAYLEHSSSTNLARSTRWLVIGPETCSG